MTNSKVINIDGTPYNGKQVQSSEPQLRIGKSYVLRDRESAEKYFENHGANVDYTDAYYNDETGFTIEEVDSDGHGYIDANLIIDVAEIKFFKEVPEL